jgi:hypothetical protein
MRIVLWFSCKAVELQCGPRCCVSRWTYFVGLQMSKKHKKNKRSPIYFKEKRKRIREDVIGNDSSSPARLPEEIDENFNEDLHDGDHDHYDDQPSQNHEENIADDRPAIDPEDGKVDEPQETTTQQPPITTPTTRRRKGLDVASARQNRKRSTMAPGLGSGEGRLGAKGKYFID